jgi:hypothetical protein
MGREHVRIVGAATPNLLPEVVLDAAKIELGFEYDAQALALGIVVDAGEIEPLRTVGAGILRGGLDGPLPPAEPDEVADFEACDHAPGCCGQ